MCFPLFHTHFLILHFIKFHFIKVKHIIRPTTETIYLSITKELNDDLDIVKYKKNNGMVEVRDKGEQKSLYIVARTEESLEEPSE